ncbi:isochorismate synthase [Acidipropionibacterium timonense]|uniref:isochorismate synthase n=1 Tax=Acidipropionibacterium timonense TaxID=2161818 RepID=UPI001031E6D3|nr:chorismate-binding protein [Acidipropionibacterium timonense]
MPDLPCSDAVSTLPGAAWLREVLAWVPDGVDPWIWLAPDSDDAPAMVGWGQQCRFTASGHGAIESAWHRLASWAGREPVIAFGSFPFSRAQEGFLVVPRVLIIRRHLGGPTTVLGDYSPVRRDIAEAVEPHLTRCPAVDEATWTASVSAATRRLGADERLEKVVLAGAVDVHSNAVIDRGQVAAQLAARFPGCWTYSHDGLVGATPELLVDCRDGLFRCRVLAGTRKPAWADELLHDPKERHEHELAVTSVTGRLVEAGLVDPVVRGPFRLELPNVVHLATDVTARVSGSNAARIVDAMHPTAAVCGTPREEAYDLIGQVEQLDRGRFAGPVGWMGSDGSGQWALALRCGQFSADSREVRMYAGAGIMPSSDPAKEWIEIGAKMEAFASGLPGR